MSTGRQFVIAVAATVGFAVSAVMAQPTSPGGPGADLQRHGSAGHDAMRPGMGPAMGMGMGMGMGPGGGRGRGPVGLLTRQDENSAADMRIAMNLVHENVKVQRTVTRLPDGIRTVTESDDPTLAQDIKVHVASMSGRLESGKEFNIFSTTLPVIFDHARSIQSTIEYTAKGAIVTRTSKDPKVVAALQGHADEVTELVNEGPIAFHRGVDRRMAMGAGGPRGGHDAAPTRQMGQGRQQHAH